ncbi:MAG: hypothetical protein AAF518_11325 [Spirochaetota bacterium]
MLGRISSFLLFLLFGLSYPAIAQKKEKLFLKQAINLYRLQYRAIKNYRVLQKVNLKTTDDYGIVTQEQREQVTYYVAPKTFIHQIYRKTINNIPQYIDRNHYTKSIAQSENWLLQETRKYQFRLVDTTNELNCYQITAIQINSQSQEGQVCFHRETYRLHSLTQRPARLPKSIQEYKLHISYRDDTSYTVPATTILRSKYRSGKLNYQLRIEIEHKSYKFNQANIPNLKQKS